MKVFLRIFGYGGMGLIVLGCILSNNGLAVLGAGLIIIAVVEAIVKYGK